LYAEAKVAVDGVVADVVVSIGRGNFSDRGHNLVAKTKMDSVLPQKFCRGSESILPSLTTDDVNGRFTGGLKTIDTESLDSAVVGVLTEAQGTIGIVDDVIIDVNHAGRAAPS
jgi:hypothetical protein